ncbi:hypothetical protein BV898_07655 [Hypsibius exemplaris]|uniref:Structure-specific endonuclease subunit SLX4 n=1 Tax=Hypsibius exemplaris TaxID=2072580 RepID=A0A1W0WST1_HYPEX|nr:hypothetical protein BV898_07655 [Hypsibius exemplaris]
MSKTSEFVGELISDVFDKNAKSSTAKPPPPVQAVPQTSDTHLKALEKQTKERERQKTAREASVEIVESADAIEEIQSSTSRPVPGLALVKCKSSHETDRNVVKRRRTPARVVAAATTKVQDDSVMILSPDNSLVLAAGATAKMKRRKSALRKRMLSAIKVKPMESGRKKEFKVILVSSSSSEDESPANEPVLVADNTPVPKPEILIKKKSSSSRSRSKLPPPPPHPLLPITASLEQASEEVSPRKIPSRKPKKISLVSSDETETEVLPSGKRSKSKKISLPDKVRTVMLKYFHDRPALYNKILLYETIYIKPFMQQLKADGLIIKTESLMDFFDSQTICFSQHDAQKPRSWGGKKKRGQSPKKTSPSKTAVPVTTS